MYALRILGRYAGYIAAAALLLLGCSKNTDMGALSAQAPEVRALAALMPGADATFEQRAAAAGVPAECYSEGLIANENANAVGQELLGFVPNPKCLGIKKLDESAGNRVGGFVVTPQADWSADQPAACIPANAIALSRGEGSVAEMKIFFGSYASRKPLVLTPSIQANSLPSGNYSIAIAGDTATVRVRLSASLPLEQFAIRTGVTTAFGERKECQFVVAKAPETAQPIVIPPVEPEVVVVVPAPDAPEEQPAAPVAEQPANLPAPEGEGEEASPAPVVVVDQPSAPAEESPAPAEEVPAPPVVIIIPPSDPIILTPEVPVAEEPAPEVVAELPASPPPPVFNAPEANAPVNPGVPAPDFQNPPEGPVVVVEELPPPVLNAPPPPQPVEPLPPIVLTPMEEGPTRNTASTPEVASDDQASDESEEIDGSIVDDNDATDNGGLATSNLGVECLGNPTLAAGDEGYVQMQLSRALTRGERRTLRAVFRIHDRLEGLMAERQWTTHQRSLKLRMRAPQSIGFLHRSTVELAIGGASAACQVTFTPGYRDDSGKLIPLNGGYCGLASIGAYSAVLDKSSAEAEVFFAAQVGSDVRFSVDQGAIDLSKDLSVKVSGPFSQKIKCARRTTSGVLRISYAYRIGAQTKSDTCTVSVPPLEAIAALPPPAYVGSQGLVGQVYQLAANAPQLYTRAKLDTMNPMAPIFMSMLDVAPRDFSAGFPGVKSLFEWFQLRIGRVSPSENVPNVRIFLPEATTYMFRTNADDGVKVYIDGKLVINDDGQHAPHTRESAELALTAGYHDFAVDYFQGPRYQIALTLEWKSRGLLNNAYALTRDYKLVPAAAFFTDPQAIAVTAQ